MPETNPYRSTLCVMLADGKHADGLLLDRIVHWFKYSKVTLPGSKGTWIANPTSWWMREACLSKDQYDRSIKRLKQRGLVEARQWWFGKKNILHVRPTEAAIQFLAASKTWQAADEFILAPQNEHISSIAIPDAAIPLNFNEVSKDAESSSANALHSNNTGNNNLNETSKHKDAHPASPSCVASSLKVDSKILGGKEDIKNNSIGPETVKYGDIDIYLPTVKYLASIWRAACLKYHGCGADDAPDLSCDEVGLLAKFLSGMSKFDAPDATDWRPFTPYIIAYTVAHWSRFEDAYGNNTDYPSFKMFYLGGISTAAINRWIKEGHPEESLKKLLVEHKGLGHPWSDQPVVSF
jgi:hypothetical protein